MWFGRRKKPTCVLYEGIGILNNMDVHIAATQALRDAGLVAEAEELDARFWELADMPREKRGDFAKAAKKLVEEYVRVKVIAEHFSRLPLWARRAT